MEKWAPSTAHCASDKLQLRMKIRDQIFEIIIRGAKPKQDVTED